MQDTGFMQIFEFGKGEKKTFTDAILELVYEYYIKVSGEFVVSLDITEIQPKGE